MQDPGQDPYAALGRPVGPPARPAASQDPYAAIGRPVGPAAPAPQSARPAPRQDPARPAAPARPASAPQAQTLGDTGLTREEIFAAQRQQGYSDEDIAANMAEMGLDAGPVAPPPAYEVVASAYTNETPEQLRAAGYEWDPATGSWAKTVGAIERPAAPAQEAVDPGYALALEQERAALDERSDLGLRRYDEPNFMDQATAPINDEIGWLVGLLTQGAGNIGRRLTGREIEVGALDRARAMRSLTREGQERFERENPDQAIGGALLGGLVLGPARGAGILPNLGNTAGGRIGQAAAVGGAYGASEGDGTLGRIGGAATGAVVSAGTAGLLEGGGAVLGGLLTRRARAAQGLPTGRSPEVRVGETVNRALARDSIEPQAYLSALDEAAPGQLPFERGGENLRGLAEVGAQAPGRTRGLLTEQLNARSDEATNRVSDRIGEAFGAEGNVFQALRQKVKARGEAADEGMARFGDRQVELGDSAIQALRQGLASRAVRDEAVNAAAELTPAGQAAANRLFGLADEALDKPAAARLTIREAQDISYALREAAGRAFRGGFNSRGKALDTLSKAIRGAARSDGDYAKWLKDFGDASDTIEALRRGRNVFARSTEDNAMSAAELREAFPAMSQAARDNFRLGVGEALLDRARSGGGVTAMRRLLKDREIADRVRVAFGSDDAFARFMRAADDEVTMQNVANQVLGGSATARRAAGAADLKQDGSVDPAEIAGLFEGGMVGAAGKGLKAALKKLPRRDRSILGDAETNGVLADALTDPEVMRRLVTIVRGRQETESQPLRRIGLLAPGVIGSGQERGRGLLTTTP